MKIIDVKIKRSVGFSAFQIQKNCFEDLKSKNFQCENLSDSPYLWSAVWESMRISPAVYRTLLHSVNQDNTVLGYDLKKSDLVTFNLGGINMSERIEFREDEMWMTVKESELRVTSIEVNILREIRYGTTMKNQKLVWGLLMYSTIM